MHNVGSSISSLATSAAIFSTRTMTAVGVPTYLALRMLPNSPLKVPGNRAITATLVTLSAPSTLTCGLGATEWQMLIALQLAYQSPLLERVTFVNADPRAAEIMSRFIDWRCTVTI